MSAGSLSRGLGLALGLWACTSGPGTDLTDEPVDTGGDTDQPPTLDERLAELLALTDPLVTAVDPPPSLDPDLVEVGRLLFFDPILSGNKDVACATCHDAEHGLSDGLPLTLGTGARGRGPARAQGDHPPWGRRRAPALWGRHRLDALFWDGRVQVATDGVSAPLPLPAGGEALSLLAVQALHPILDRAEMLGKSGDTTIDGQANELAILDEPAAIYQAIEDRLRAIEGYDSRLTALNESWSMVEVVGALGAYQTVTFDASDSRWDRYLRGATDALTGEEKLGATFFFADGRCVSCHAGPALTDQAFHNIGLQPVGPVVDIGREAVTGDPDDRFGFRTPPLRNVATQQPLTHNGTLLDLEAITVHYADPEGRRASLDHLASDIVVIDDEAVLRDLVNRLAPEMPLASSGVTTVGLSNIRVFLGALTDQSAVDRSREVPSSVPSGLTVGGGG